MSTPPIGLNLADTHLQFLFTLEPLRYAALSEYASAAGLDVFEVLTALKDALDDDLLALETVGDEVFVHTRPERRPPHANVQPNLWEVLRLAGSAEYAYSLWRLVRGLEWAGWRVLVRPELARGTQAGFLSVEIDGSAVPVLAFPATATLGNGTAFAAAAGSADVAVTISAGTLETASTAVRRHLLTGQAGALRVVLLEAPRYQPVLLETQDTAVRARSVSVESLQGPPRRR